MAPPTGPTVLDFESLDVSKITFSDVKVMEPNKNKMVYLNYNNKPLFITTKTMRLPFGLSSYPKDSDDYSIQPSVDEENGATLEKINEIEEHIVNHAFGKSMEWFTKKFASAKILADANFQSVISYSKDKDGEVNNAYPPTLKFKIAKDCDAFYGKDQPCKINPETIVKNCKVKTIVRLATIWIVGSRFGVSWKAQQIHVTLPKASTKPTFVFDEDDDDCGDEHEQV